MQKLMLSSGQGRHVSSVFCGSIVFLRHTVVPDADIVSSQGGSCFGTHYLPSLFPHPQWPNLSPSQLLFAVKQNLVEASNGFDRRDVHKLLSKGNKRRHFKTYGGKKVSECTSYLSLCHLLLPEECISNHRACVILLLRRPERPKTWLYLEKSILLSVYDLIITELGPCIALPSMEIHRKKNQKWLIEVVKI